MACKKTTYQLKGTISEENESKAENSAYKESAETKFEILTYNDAPHFVTRHSIGKNNCDTCSTEAGTNIQEAESTKHEPTYNDAKHPVAKHSNGTNACGTISENSETTMERNEPTTNDSTSTCTEHSAEECEIGSDQFSKDTKTISKAAEQKIEHDNCTYACDMKITDTYPKDPEEIDDKSAESKVHVVKYEHVESEELVV